MTLLMDEDFWIAGFSNNPSSCSLIPAIATGIALSSYFSSASFDFDRLAKSLSVAAFLAAGRPNQCAGTHQIIVTIRVQYE